MLLLGQHVGREYYFPLNAHLLLPSLGQLYSTAETRRVSGFRFQLEERVLQSFLLALFSTTEAPAVIFSSRERTQLIQFVQEPFNPETGASPACRVKLIRE